MNQRGFVDVLRILFNTYAAVALLISLALASGSEGSWEAAAFFPMFLYIFSIPTGALAFAVMPLSEMVDVVTNPYARVFLTWAPFYVLGWAQWALIIPALGRLIHVIGQRTTRAA